MNIFPSDFTGQTAAGEYILEGREHFQTHWRDPSSGFNEYNLPAQVPKTT